MNALNSQACVFSVLSLSNQITIEKEHYMKQVASPFKEIELMSEELKFIVDNICYTEIKPSEIHGYGLFALKQFHQGETLCWLDGQVIDWQSYNEIYRKNIYGNNHIMFREWNALSQNTLLVRIVRTKYGFINHSKSPNLIIKYDPIRVVALREIKSGEELTLDYRCEPLSEEYIKRSTYLGV